MSEAEPLHEGDPKHPNHDAYLRALGAAVFSAAGVAGILVDISRIHFRDDFFEVASDPLGALVNRLRGHANRGSSLPDLKRFLDDCDRVREVRNDLIHGLPVAYGLHRRTKSDRARVVNFYSVNDLVEAQNQFDAVRGTGNRILYFDGGVAVRAYGS